MSPHSSQQGSIAGAVALPRSPVLELYEVRKVNVAFCSGFQDLSDAINKLLRIYGNPEVSVQSVLLQVEVVVAVSDTALVEFVMKTRLLDTTLVVLCNGWPKAFMPS